VIALTYSWSCLGDGHNPCDEHGDGPKSDLAARKHTEATQHATSTHARPA
jgi:hypothetical protein